MPRSDLIIHFTALAEAAEQRGERDAATMRVERSSWRSAKVSAA